MPVIEVPVRRVSVVSARPFEEIVDSLATTIGHPDMNTFHKTIGEANTVADLEGLVHGAIGSSGLMEFVRFDAGEVLRKERNGQGPKILRIVVGNPLIAPYGSQAALLLARDLDTKIEGLIEAAAR